MLRFLARRLIQAILLVFVTSVIVFAAVYAIGDPLAVLVNPNTPPDVVARTARELGLDRPLVDQFGLFLFRAAHGELGNSYVFGEPALKLILERFPATLELVVAAMFIAVLVGAPLGLIAGYSQRASVKIFLSNISVFGVSVPTFWLGLMLIMLLSVDHHLLPSGGRGTSGVFLGVWSSFFTMDGLKHLVLPALTLSFFPMCVLLRMIETSLEDTLRQDHVRFARALGISKTRVVFSYAMRSMLVPIVTVMGVIFSTLVAFSVVTETIFSWPGVGKLIMDSIRNTDRPVVVAYILFVVILVTFTNAMVDILCSMIDPRIRLSEASE